MSRAELALARYVGADAALLFSSGYAANVGTLSALANHDDLILSDALNHASLIDGCRLSRATVHVFPHAAADEAERILATHRHRYRRAFLVTDAVFSMDGDLAPLAAHRSLADRYDAALVVDEAHALGVLGPRGSGLSAQLGVTPDVMIGTLGKSFGLAGAFAAATAPVIDLLYNRARSFVFSTAPPPALAGAIPTAVQLVEAADDRRTRLRHLSHRLRQGLEALGLPTTSAAETPIVPVHIGDPGRAADVADALLASGHFVSAIRPPTVPPGTSRLRVVPIATHDTADVDALLEALATTLHQGPP